MTTTSTTEAPTTAELIEARLEVLADDRLTGYGVIDRRGNLVGFVETTLCGCCWTARVFTAGLLGGMLVMVETVDDALDGLAAVLHADVESLELAD